jgi:uncharacterized membrane protein
MNVLRISGTTIICSGLIFLVLGILDILKVTDGDGGTTYLMIGLAMVLSGFSLAWQSKRS